MKIIPKMLAQGPNHWVYNGLAERAAATLLSTHFQQIIESYSQGFFPAYDVIISGKKIEIKFQTSHMLFIEMCRADGTPSGLMTTEADSYLLFNPGGNNRTGTITGKPRLISTELLAKVIMKRWQSGEKMVTFEANGDGPGASGYYIDPRTLVNDGWLGFDVAFSREDGEATYDLSDIIEYKPMPWVRDGSYKKQLQDIERRYNAN